MSNDITGIHHVTALCGAPIPNLRFYTGVLGLRLVKRTVNFDNPDAYHFYFGDRTGRPGTLITFFPHGGWRAGEPGTREVARTDFAVPAGSLDYWSERLAAAGVAVTRQTVVGREGLRFRDPDGMDLAMTAADDVAVGAEPPTSDVPAERAIRGIASVATLISQLEPTAAFLTGTLGFRHLHSVGSRSWFEPGAGDRGQRIEVVADPSSAPAVLGVGSVHHVAWRVADGAAQARVRASVEGKVTGMTDLRDRNYFRSIYFREPGGVIYEVATEGPGFLVDEDEATLGTALKLPEQFEPRRAQIEAALPPLKASTP